MSSEKKEEERVDARDSAADNQDVEELVEDEEKGENGGEEQEDESQVDEEIENMRRKMKEIEEEQERIMQMQTQIETNLSDIPNESKEDTDARSIYVGNVDYGTKPEELQEHFKDCGVIHRVTILVDRFTGHPKGFAYVEFAEKESVTTALALDESLFRGRQLKVKEKRTNVPGMSTRRPRGFRGYRGFGPRRGYRGRRSFYHPYYS